MVELIKMQQLNDTVMLTWTSISEQAFQHVVEFAPWRIKEVLRGKNRVQCNTINVYLMNLSVSECLY